MRSNSEPSANARRTYQEQKDALEKAIESGETELINTMVRRHLRNALDNLNQLDAGTHFSQEVDPLVEKIVTGELNSTKKVIRK